MDSYCFPYLGTQMIKCAWFDYISANADKKIWQLHLYVFITVCAEIFYVLSLLIDLKR